MAELQPTVDQAGTRQRSTPWQEIDLLRHGAVVGDPCYRGRRNDPLSSIGWKQMEAAVSRLAESGHRWSLIVSSDRVRCSTFAKRLAEQLRLPLWIEPDLAELDVGSGEGKDAGWLFERDRDRLLAFWDDPVSNPPPGGESLADFDCRVDRAWQTLLERAGQRSLLMIAHAGTIRSIVASLLSPGLLRRNRLAIPHAATLSMRRYLAGETVGELEILMGVPSDGRFVGD